MPAASAFSVARSSTKLAQDASGHWWSFANDVAALTNRGLLIEPAATNVLRNASGQGAVAGSPGTFPTHWARFAGGGPVLSVVGTGTELGLPYVDIRLHGEAATSSGAAIHFEQTTSAAAAAGQEWTSSVFVRLIAGSLGNLSNLRLNIQEFNGSGAGTYLHYGADVREQVSQIPIRVVETKTLLTGGTEFLRCSLEFTYLEGKSLDLILRLFCPQLEEASFSTSPILTSGVSSTREADVLDLPLAEGSHDVTIYRAEGSQVQLLGVLGGGWTSIPMEGSNLIKRILSEAEG
ncbi:MULTISPECIES: phage head spike fiber domain-containing protein [Devosia]|uniref:phage head spike fiber domain-containing protein n=1 Tax=Devosia TaxID=46913 RepID=UPI000CE95E72|nr:MULTISPECIES: hypothetical protein [Devosia]AVF05066.1 hypothetical protein C4375_16045 [Devosia sp. I507]